MSEHRPLPGGPIRHLYAHIPFCHRICPYCSFYKHTPGSTDMAGFVDALLAEIDYRTRTLELRPETIYFGGGTPSMLSMTHLGKLFEGLHNRFDLSQLQEWTLEANPRTFDLAKARLMADAGVTRVSLGVQSWNPRHLETLGRDHTPQEAAEAFHLLREAGIPVVNLDHMFALPGQSPAEWEQDLQKTLALRPDHISTYNLTYEEDTDFMRRFERGEYHQDPDSDAVFFELSDQVLVAAGFSHYETSNFAGPGGKDFRSHHNRAYWRGADYLGIGPGAVSTIHRRRWTNLPDTAKYIECARRFGHAETAPEEIDDAAWLIERIALELRTSDGLRLSLLDETRREILRGPELADLVYESEGCAVLTSRGRLLVDSVAAALV